MDNPYALDGIYYTPSPDNIIGQNKRRGDLLYNENNKFNKSSHNNNNNNLEKIFHMINYTVCDNNNKKRKIQSK